MKANHITFVSSLNERGQRSNNEDTIISGDLWNNAGRFFVVCDGVGGNTMGERASELACQKIHEYLTREFSYSDEYELINQLMNRVETDFDDYINECPNAKSMATTMALAILYSGKAVIAHIGDSRIYHIRNNQILFKTQDHSLVNEFVKSGIITAEEALTHPQRNVIMRAIQGKPTKPMKADVHIINNVKSSDYFFICSDGILESIDETRLIEILADQSPNEEKMAYIHQKCEECSRDNYSAYLIQIGEDDYCK
jgi:protein phosphatase